MRRILGFLLAAVLVSAEAAVCWAEAQVGKPAPDFTLADTDGQPRTLSGLKGRYVVLEWSNHECPFTKKHYTSGNMQRLQAHYTGKGVIWLTMVSSAPGKQGHVTPTQANTIREVRGDHSTAMLLDPGGRVGRLYGAKTTPHLFVLNPDGLLIYAGAIDDKPTVDPAGTAAATNYVRQALDEAMAGKPVSVSETKPYGCSVKY